MDVLRAAAGERSYVSHLIDAKILGRKAFDSNKSFLAKP